jgi:hypothetical protein
MSDDLETVQGSLPDDIPRTWYAVKVMPGRNTTVVSRNRLLVIDDFGEGLINKSWNSGVVILRNRTCKGQPEGVWRCTSLPIIRISYWMMN